MKKSVIHVINLARREDRYTQFIEQGGQQGFWSRRWDGIEIPQLPFVGISRAHKQIVTEAKKNGDSTVTIAEDDCIFSAPGAWRYYVSQEPESYDIYFGSVYKSIIEDGRIKFGLSGLTLYTVHERFYDDFLLMKEMNHLDREIGRFAWKYEYKVCDPMVAYQSNGWSDNRKADENYDHLLEGIKLFGHQ